MADFLESARQRGDRDGPAAAAATAGRRGQADEGAGPQELSALPAGRPTIYAPATPPGRGAVAILRISGPRARSVLGTLAGDLPPPRRASLRTIRDPLSGEPIDRALVLWMPGPASYTGEDMAEIQHHGGVAVLTALLDALAAIPGTRLAEPGEFTRRAFLAGRMDLTEAEAVADLVDATTRAQARLALRQLEGGLGRLYEGWRERLLAARAEIEAEIDFAAEESDVPERALERILPQIAALEAELAAHLDDARRGERLRAGLTVAVIGPPNAGKSSLVNLLARREVAIVTPVAGTTRDVLEVQLELDGLPLTVLDTAGLRDTDDPVEAEGVRRARARAADADLRLHLLDATDPRPLVPAADPDTLPVWNKTDLAPPPAAVAGAVAISCATGAGIDALLAWLVERARAMVASGAEAVITRARHRAAVAEARDALGRILAGEAAGEPALVAEDLRLAARALGRITGRVDVEDVLDRIFARFCIGK